MNRRGLSSVALAVLAVFAIACAYEAWLTVLAPLEAAETPVRGDHDTGLLAPLRDPGPPAFAPLAMVTAPLFLATRTPPPLQPVVSESPPEVMSVPASPAAVVITTPPNYTLAGVMISPSGRKVLLRKHMAEKGAWINHGKTTDDGWIVLTVAPEKVTLSRDDHEFRLLLRVGPQGK